MEDGGGNEGKGVALKESGVKREKTKFEDPQWIINNFELEDENVINIYPYGSRVYGTASVKKKSSSTFFRVFFFVLYSSFFIPVFFNLVGGQ